MKINSALKTAFLFFCCSCTTPLVAQTITGHVFNRTSNKPAAGDQVILLRLDEGMQEESRTTTQPDGAFSLRVSSPDAAHMVRVIHQGVNYDQKENDSRRVDVEVFNAVDRVPGLTARVGMAQVESRDGGLMMTEMYELVNGSIPPMTQWRPANFEFSLPFGALLESFQAKRRDGIWVNLKPSSVLGVPSRYAVDFPIRPGDTLFRFVYRIPYSGMASLKISPAYPLKNFAVAHPPAMVFKPLHPEDFTSPGVTRGLRLEQMTNKSGLIREIPEFEISGGASAATSQPATNQFESSPTGTSLTGTHATGAPESNGAWGLIAAGFVFLASVLFSVWRKRIARHRPAAAMQQTAGSAR